MATQSRSQSRTPPKPKPAEKPKGERPKVTVRLGNVKVSCWENTGEYGTWYSCKVARIYKDGKGEWQQTDSLNDSDLPHAAHVIGLAFTELSFLKGGKVEIRGEGGDGDGDQNDGGNGGGGDEIPF